MKQSARGIIKIMLSGAWVTALMLGFFASQAMALTNVYEVRPDSAANSGWANTVWESFSATCDSIDSVSFFIGAEVPHKIYTAQVYDSVTQQVVWSTTRSSTGWKYQDMGFGVRKPVVRGKKYCLQLSIADSSFLPLQWNYCYRNGNPYPWGVMGGFGTGKDLVARVIGRGRVPRDFWGVNSEFPWWDNLANRDTVAARAKAMGMKVFREQLSWSVVETLHTYFDWRMLDTTVRHAAKETISVVINIYECPRWASSAPDSQLDTIRAKRYPPIHLTKPIFGVTGQPDTSNYYGYLIYNLVQRYKANGIFWQQNPGLPQVPVTCWEVFNETNNFYDAWNWPDKTKDSDPLYQITRGDTVGLNNLYVKACEVAWKAAKQGPNPDANAKILAGALARVHADPPWGNDPQKGILGRSWLNMFYTSTNSGKQWCDVITFHPYQHPDTTAGFDPYYFQADADTVRAILARNGDRDKEAWGDEVGLAGVDPTTSWSPTRVGQATALVRLYTKAAENLNHPNGPVSRLWWYILYDRPDSLNSRHWYSFCGTLDSTHATLPYNSKPAYYAYRQMTTKLKSQLFNQRIAHPDPKLFAYEYQIPDSDKALKTWCLWRDSGQAPNDETLSIRTNVAWLVTRDTIGNPDSSQVDVIPDGSGKIKLRTDQMDTVPRYLHEYGAVSRPDVVVDSLWLVPTNPKAGEGLRFYARIKNISTTDSLKGSITNLVKFQVDGVTKATYQAQRGLGVANSGTDTLTVGYYGNSTNGGEGWDRDWTAKWGDHLIRAWADSSDKYVELREDNNTKYLWKHFQPKVSVVINNDHKYTNHLNNDTLHLVMNESTSPLPDSAKLKHEGGSWIRLGVYGSRDTIVSYSGNGVAYDSVKVFQGSDVATGWDSIIVDAEAPFVDITSPIMNQTVSGLVPFVGWSWDYQDHDSLWEIYVNGSPWCYGNGKVGENPMMGLPDTFGIWDSRTVPNGWRWHQLRSTDAATNLAKDSVKVRVRNNQTNGGDSWVSGFGTFTSPVMNVATDIGGNVYFAETQNSKVRKYSPRKDSLFAFSAKRGNDSTGTSWATAMILKDSITLWIADGYAHAIKKFDRQGNLLLRFGSFGSDTSHFKQPCGIALDHKNRLWVSDRLNHRIQVFDSTGGFLFQFGSQGADSGRFNSPTGITITPNGLVWVSDTRNNQVQVFDSLGHYLKTIKQVDSLGLDTPLGICSDKWGNVFIADAHHNRIVELNPYGQRILDFGGQGDSLWQFRTPVGLASSPGAHYLYVADMGNRRVQKFIVIEEDTTGGGPQAGAVVQVLPLVYELGPAIPNPSKGQTTFRYALPKESRVNMTFYNVAGQVVKEFNQEKQKAGYYSLTWDGRNNQGHKVGPGVYFYRLTAGSWVKTRKLVIIR